MIKKNSFEELSASLSEKERADLLNKINATLSRQNSASEDFTYKELSKNERTALLHKELAHISWFRRFILWFQSKLSGRSLTESLSLHKMRSLKKKINHKQKGLTGFEARNLTPQLAEEVFKIYTETLNLRPLYKKIWFYDGIEAAVMYLAGKEFGTIKTDLESFISLQEIVDIYEKSGRKDTLKSKAGERVDRYLADLPEEGCRAIENRIRPIYRIKDVMLFPYTSFFQKFSFTPDYSRENAQPFFKNASAMLCLDELEKLYYAVYTANKIDSDDILDVDFYAFLNRLVEEPNGEGADSPAIEPAAEDHGGAETSAVEELDEEEGGEIRDDLLRVISRCKDFFVHVPLAEIIKFFKNDPFYQLIFYLSDFKLDEYLGKLLRKRISQEIDHRFEEFQRLYIEREIKRVFNDQALKPFLNYRDYTSIDYEKMKLPFFAHTQSLNILFNYIIQFYKSGMQEIIQILEKGLLAQNRIAKDRLTGAAGEIEEVLEKIRSFDYSLSPDSEDGKIFQKVRFSLSSENSHQKMFRNIVLNKDREVKSLLERGEDAFFNLQKIFTELTKTTSQLYRDRLNSHYLIGGRSTTLIHVLQQKIDHIHHFRNLFNHIKKLERD